MLEPSTLQNVDKLEELKKQANQEKVVSRWKSQVAERRQERDTHKAQDKSEQPPKLVRTNKASGSINSETVAKKWLNKSKVGSAASQPTRKHLPSNAASKWASATSKTMNNLAKQAGNPSNHHSRKPPSLTHSKGLSGSSLKPTSLQQTIANKPSSLQQTIANRPSSLASKPSLSSSGPKTSWQRAALKSKAVNNLNKPVSSSKPAPSVVGAKKPYVPYKSTAKPGFGGKPGLGGPGKKGPMKLGGGKMGGRLF